MVLVKTCHKTCPPVTLSLLGSGLRVSSVQVDKMFCGYFQSAVCVVVFFLGGVVGWFGFFCLFFGGVSP